MENIVNANPTKEFFISMLTRDVDVKAAILELIDNSIDGAKRLRPDGDYSGLYIRIQYDAKSFSITDNCGGISIYTAQNTAFRFGRSIPVPNETKQHLTGVFGIGMKRSLFRLGNYFEVESKTQSESFKIAVDVKKWMEDTGTDWSFSFAEMETNLNNEVDDTGTRILITSLHEGISNQFGLAYFSNSLITYIERFKTLAVGHGLEISVNNRPITFADEKIIESEAVVPYCYAGTLGSVSYKIIAGVAPKGEPEKAGWYIYCNGRLVVFADKTSLSGWGEDGIRNYHPSLAFFRGFVFFESTSPDDLPWNTAKTGIDTSSKCYIIAKFRMKDATKNIINDCKSLSEDEYSATEENIVLSTRNLITLNTNTITRLCTSNKPFSLKNIVVKPVEPTSTITFRRPTKMIEKAKKKIGASSNKDVGIYSFEYFFKRECDDDA